MIEFRENPVPSARQSCRQIAVKRIADIISELAGNSEPITEEAAARWQSLLKSFKERSR